MGVRIIEIRTRLVDVFVNCWGGRVGESLAKDGDFVKAWRALLIRIDQAGLYFVSG